MKKIVFNPVLLIASVAILTVGFSSCKGKVKDSDITTAINTKIASVADMAKIKVDNVQDGVVTISGECKDDACITACAAAIKGIPGVKEVVNNTTVTPPPPPPAPPVVTSADDVLSNGLTDALKDFPGVTSSVKDGVVTLTGEIAKAKWVVLKQAIDKLTPKGYDLKGLKIK
jgi:osmotically-inducible protein OsmY